jgi:hypothetical protein
MRDEVSEFQEEAKVGHKEIKVMIDINLGRWRPG